MNKWAFFGLFFCIFVFILTISTTNSVFAELSMPISPPPNGNTPSFLLINDLSQGKSGPLRLGTSDLASPFNYQLEVLGDGAASSHGLIENNLLIWDNYNEDKVTLMVDSKSSKVCIGPCLNVNDTKLEVNSPNSLRQGVIIDNTQITGRGLSSFSSNEEAIYGSGDTGGIKGLASGNENYGINAVSIAGVALEGANTATPEPLWSSVAGFSSTGIGIYGTNINKLGLWSGYFNGRVETNSDVSAAKMLSNNLENSLIPYTAGSQIDVFSYGSSSLDVKYFDGTHLWLVSNGELLKVRVSDGFKIFETEADINAVEVIFDGNYIWAAVDDPAGDKISKINYTTGIEECSTPVADPSGLVFTGTDYFALSADTGEIIPIDGTDCDAGTPVKIVTPDDHILGKMIFDGTYLWTFAVDGAQDGYLININPSTLEAIVWSGWGSVNPTDIYFDNYYYWITNSGKGTVKRFFKGDRVCTQLDTNKSSVACFVDDDCNPNPGGSCGLVFPQEFGEFPVSNDDNHISDSPSDIIFDGSSMWINNQWTDSDGMTHDELVRMQAGEPTQIENYSLNFIPTGLVFDDTYLWVSSIDASLTKLYSGSGFGSTDLSRILTLQYNSFLVTQEGGFDIQGSGQFGDNIIGSGDLISLDNVWGDGLDTIEDGTTPIGQGTHTCLDGYFVTNIEVNAGGEVTKIECRQL